MMLVDSVVSIHTKAKVLRFWPCLHHCYMNVAVKTGVYEAKTKNSRPWSTRWPMILVFVSRILVSFSSLASKF